MFSSGATHGLYAQFCAQSKLANKGQIVGLLRGSGTRMALWFYALIRMLRLQHVLKATINQVKFRDLLLSSNTTKGMRECVADIENPSFFKAIYIMLRAVFPALRALRYCDSNLPMMDKIYYLSHRASEALKKSVDELDNDDLFKEFEAAAEISELSLEEEQVFGGNAAHFDMDSDDDEEDEE